MTAVMPISERVAGLARSSGLMVVSDDLFSGLLCDCTIPAALASRNISPALRSARNEKAAPGNQERPVVRGVT